MSSTVNTEYLREKFRDTIAHSFYFKKPSQPHSTLMWSDFLCLYDIPSFFPCIFSLEIQNLLESGTRLKTTPRFELFPIMTSVHIKLCRLEIELAEKV